MVPSTIYTFRAPHAAQPSRRQYLQVADALYCAVQDLQEQRATPLLIARAGRVLYDAAAIRRLWEACRAELTAQPWQVPARVLATGETERPATA